MSDTIGNETTSIFENDDVKQDNSIPINDLLSQLKNQDSKKEENVNETVDEQITVQKDVTTNNVPNTELTPLQKMKLEKSNNSGGVIVDNEELEKGMDKAPDGNIIYREDRIESFNNAINDLDDSTNKRNAVIITTKPVSQEDFVECMLEIDSVEFDENGKAYFNYKDKEGNDITPKFCRLRQEGEDYFDYENMGIEKPSESSDNGENSTEDDSEKKKIVQVLIDKTGLGIDFKFTEDEKAKIEEADTIRINEVDFVDIEAINSKRSDKSFQDVVKEFNYNGTRATICFPASGYKAQLKGMTYGEYSDVALSMENITFDQYYKRLSIIYNKMTNISTGPFKDFEDFLKHTAYTDISLAVYGLFLATEKDDQEIQLRCGSSSCNQLFNWKYNTRSLLRLDRCADKFLTKMQELTTAPAMEYDRIKKESAVENSKFIKLPESGFVVEMGIASAYDFLYNFIPLMDEETFKAAFGNDENDLYKNNLLLLTSIRSVRVPSDGDFIVCEGYKDILDAIYNISPREIKILAAYTAKLQSNYEMTFSLGKVECSHCHNITENLDITIDDLVFQTFSLLMNTEIDLSNIQDL